MRSQFGLQIEFSSIEDGLHGAGEMMYPQSFHAATGRTNLHTLKVDLFLPSPGIMWYNVDGVHSVRLSQKVVLGRYHLGTGRFRFGVLNTVALIHVLGLYGGGGLVPIFRNLPGVYTDGLADHEVGNHGDSGSRRLDRKNGSIIRQIA